VLASPELLMVTAGPVVVVTVVCDGDAGAVVVPVDIVCAVPLLAVDPETDVEGGVEIDELVVLLFVVVSTSPVELVDEPASGEANAAPGHVTAAVPMPSATANAPPPIFSTARIRRDPPDVLGTLGGGPAIRCAHARRWLSAVRATHM